MTRHQEAVLLAIGTIWSYYPEWRLGQLVENVSSWSRPPDGKSVYGVEDDELVTSLIDHLERRFGHEAVVHLHRPQRDADRPSAEPVGA